MRKCKSQFLSRWGPDPRDGAWLGIRPPHVCYLAEFSRSRSHRVWVPMKIRWKMVLRVRPAFQCYSLEKTRIDWPPIRLPISDPQ